MCLKSRDVKYDRLPMAHSPMTQGGSTYCHGRPLPRALLMQIPLTSRAKLGTDSREVGCCIRYEGHMQRSNTACASILRQFFIFSYRDLRTREASPDCTTCNDQYFGPRLSAGYSGMLASLPTASQGSSSAVLLCQSARRKAAGRRVTGGARN